MCNLSGKGVLRISCQRVEVSNTILSPVLPFSFEGSGRYRDFREKGWVCLSMHVCVWLCRVRGAGGIWYVWVVTQPSATPTSGKVSTPGRREAADCWRTVKMSVLMEEAQYAVTEQSVVLWQWLGTGHAICSTRGNQVESQLSQQKIEFIINGWSGNL